MDEAMLLVLVLVFLLFRFLLELTAAVPLVLAARSAEDLSDTLDTSHLMEALRKKVAL